MRRKTKTKSQPGFITCGKFHFLLQRKYGLSIQKEKLIHALAGPRDAVIPLESIKLPDPQPVLEEQPAKFKRGRLSYLRKQEMRRHKSAS
jgi:hypothetical protein